MHLGEMRKAVILIWYLSIAHTYIISLNKNRKEAYIHHLTNIAVQVILETNRFRYVRQTVHD